MSPLRCATHTVRDLDGAVARFGEWLDYRMVERGVVAAEMAAAWGTPASAGRRYAVCQPASGAEVFLRLVEGDAVPGYLPIRSHGWAAIEISVANVLAVNEQMLRKDSPFEVIGPPTRIAGLPTIFPMQVRGPDQETLYFTQIAADAPGLTPASAPIDQVFILVLACRDVRATARWFAGTLGLAVTDPVTIRYSMINKAFGLPVETTHEIVTASRGGDIFLEFDQYPNGATERATHAGALPPGVSICTLACDLDHITSWFSAPVVRPCLPYAGRRVGVLKTPEGALLELVEA